MSTNFSIRARQIATLLDRAPPGIEVLSLDCFDTLIWRTTQAPADVFAAIDLPGGAMGPRQWSEGAARRIVAQRSRASEIGLADVYRHLLPTPTPPRSTPPSPPNSPTRRATPSPSPPPWR